MRIVQTKDKKLAFLSSWRLLIVVGMYCASIIQFGAWLIFTIEQKPMHPVGQFLLVVGGAIALVLGHFFGMQDLKKIRANGAKLEVTRIQVPLLVLCCASVPGALLVLALLSGIR